MEKDICQNCECANVCIFYNNIQKAIEPFNDDSTIPFIKVKIVLCTFYKEIKSCNDR